MAARFNRLGMEALGCQVAVSLMVKLSEDKQKPEVYSQALHETNFARRKRRFTA
jgi:hypothetical protein